MLEAICMQMGYAKHVLVAHGQMREQRNVRYVQQAIIRLSDRMNAWKHQPATIL